MSFTSISIGLKELLRDPARRNEFFKSITQDDIASQIRDLRKRREMTQAAFAKKAGMKQSAVSRMEQAEYSSWSLTTLLRAAAVLDARLRVVFQPAEEAVKEFEGLEENRKPLIGGAGSVLGVGDTLDRSSQNEASRLPRPPLPNLPEGNPFWSPQKNNRLDDSARRAY
jgi:transcriptional regulator with XRE-family HTH domain